MPVYRPSELHSLGIYARKSLSQNFLIDQNILKKIVQAADIQPGNKVLEIGPGPGALTEQLLASGAHVIAIEKDPDLAHKLLRLQTDQNHLQVICDDALTFPLETIVKKGEKIKIVANLPYHITTPLLQKYIRFPEQIDSLTVMVQKEFGKRMIAEKNTSNYSSFTLFLRAYSTPHYCFTVKPTSFFPAPSVHSCIVHLPLHPFPYSFSEEAFFLFTRTGFGKRRKMLRSSLKELYKPEQVEQGLKAIGFTPTARPEELSLEEFSALFLWLQKCSTI